MIGPILYSAMQSAQQQDLKTACSTKQKNIDGHANDFVDLESQLGDEQDLFCMHPVTMNGTSSVLSPPLPKPQAAAAAAAAQGGGGGGGAAADVVCATTAPVLEAALKEAQAKICAQRILLLASNDVRREKGLCVVKKPRPGQ